MDSSFAKLGRAQLHFDQLDAEVKAYRARDPFEWPHKLSYHLFDESLAVITYKIHIKEQMPATWGLVVGDILTNLRAALDHAIFGHAAARAEVAGTPLTTAQERNLNFPVITIANDWPNQRNRLAPLLDPAVLAVVENWQPFNQQQVPADWHQLAVLNALVNRDKHRQVRLLSYVSEEFNVKSSDHEVVRVYAQPKEMTEGAVVASMHIRRPLRQGGRSALVPGRFHVENGYTENIDIPKVGAQRSVLTVMEALVAAVEDLLNELKAAGC
ncbi:hypothetical protein HZU40_09645 [Mycolicibacterium fluoranthenivorans]|uniref:Uncharacterized protein n=1 Tax=Mycolicibacterium fluoranthenivorans TaxID=258505 RepID=A0A7G8PB14_9MYCO|nr:hypothetical protein [Mycolicibacterium fluoranthenivorans]QNJ91530.1 hypothetical protein HZU40_25575 [Mycolicibacterium fluoranthenivorans]QNJ94496.1 hypothetical protein HZU40_09645 [Mycolicibacterium fluoranthenivorans]